MTTLQASGVIYFSIGLLMCYAFDRYNKRHNVGKRAHPATYLILGFTWPYAIALAVRGAYQEIKAERDAELAKAEAELAEVEAMLNRERERLRNSRP